MSFVVEPGQTLALVGATGSGKSTLVHLLLRLREPPTAARCSSTVSTSAIGRSPACAAAMAVVPQEPFLFSDTVGGNILFGTGEDWGTVATRARAVEAGAAARRWPTTLPGSPHGLRHDRGRTGDHPVRRPEAARRRWRGPC